MARLRVLELFAGVALATGAATAAELVKIDELRFDSLQAVGFEIPRAARVHVEAVGMRPRFGRHLVAYAWILDATTRRTVWSMEEDELDRVDRERTLRRADEDLELAAGRYELYAWAGRRWEFGDGDVQIVGLDDLRGLIKHDKGKWTWSGDDEEWDRDRPSSRRLRRELEKCYVMLSSDALQRGDVRRFEAPLEASGALVRMTRMGEDACERAAFALDRSGSLHVYAFSEQPQDWDAPVDHAWIEKLATHEIVWEMTRRNTQTAGGARKNRVFDGDVQLDAGEYVLAYASDGSHSAAHWNSAPPDDPYNWGVTLLPGKGSETPGFRKIEEPARGESLVDLRRARDGEYREAPFQLGRGGALHVVAVGEWAGGDFADRAWIRKAGSDQVVWEMDEDNTHHAGGAEKNRGFDGLVQLGPGEYVACVSTDDSHSFRDWNADPPCDPEDWGLAIYSGPELRAADVKQLQEEGGSSDEGALVRLTRVGNDKHRKAKFTLERRQKVHVHALGEGTRDGMADSGWIEDAATNEVVWEMTYRNTRHAGGARKNRVFDGEIMLDPGTYEVHYETDDSHAFSSWNDTAPPAPRSWGIVVTPVK